MVKNKLAAFALVLYMAAGAFCAVGIPDRIGGWRVEVGPAGNEFYDSSAPEKKGDHSTGGTKDKPSKDKEKFERLLKNGLGEYRERFDFDKQIERLGKRPKSGDGGFRYVVMGDSRSNWDAFSSIVKHIDMIEPKPAFVINTGDIVPHGYITEYRDYYVRAVKATDIPSFVAIGNHDDSSDGKAREYRYLFGENSLNYYFDYGPNRFIFVDTATKVNDEDDTLRWLGNVLRDTPKGFKKYVTSHKPPKVIKKWSYHAWGTDESTVFVRLMEMHKVEEVYLGHIHAYSTTKLNGVKYTLSGGGGAGLHARFGPLGGEHHYVICDVAHNGAVEQQVVRFYKVKQ